MRWAFVALPMFQLGHSDAVHLLDRLSQMSPHRSFFLLNYLACDFSAFSFYMKTLFSLSAFPTGEDCDEWQKSAGISQKLCWIILLTSSCKNCFTEIGRNFEQFRIGLVTAAKCNWTRGACKSFVESAYFRVVWWESINDQKLILFGAWVLLQLDEEWSV